MTQAYQTGITADASSDASFIALDAVAGQEANLRKALAAFPDLIESVQKQFPDTELHAAIGFSIHSFERITKHAAPRELTQFPSLTGPLLSVQDQAFDMMWHIRSNRRDATHQLSLALYKAVKNFVTLKDSVDCFKYLDNRDFTGFVDGTENPQGEDRASVALVADDELQYRGGSYFNYMKFVHDLAKWEQQDLKVQEDTYGRTKYDNEEYAGADKSPHAHTKRTSLKDADGKSMELLRQSMPFGDLNEQGLIFASYSKTPIIFNLMLKSMIEGDEEGHVDHLMKYTSATHGSAFFMPPISFFKGLDA